MGKLFTEPLVVLMSLELFFCARLFFNPKVEEPKGRKRLALGALIPLSLLWLLSLPVVCNLMERGLPLEPGLVDSQPQVEAIAVLSGGYHRESDPAIDFLGNDTISRVLHGTLWWKKNPKAKFIVTGASTPDDFRTTSKEAEMMRALAIQYGVPSEKILLEPTATDTSKHPGAILKLPGMTPNTPIGIVTSAWHMRRAMLEFRRHFSSVSPYPYPKTPLEADNWISYFPHRSALGHSTTLFHEWVGMAWSYIRPKK